MRAFLYSRSDRPSCAQAREFLSRSGIDLDVVSVETTPVSRAAALDLAAHASQIVVKVGAQTRRVDAAQGPIPRDEVEPYLVHEDGFLRVPVLVVGELIVRGYTEELDRDALGTAPAHADATEAGRPRRGDQSERGVQP
jgi:arsenate reductase-like glutaredoxin family protein